MDAAKVKGLVSDHNSPSTLFNSFEAILQRITYHLIMACNERYQNRYIDPLLKEHCNPTISFFSKMFVKVKLNFEKSRMPTSLLHQYHYQFISRL